MTTGEEARWLALLSRLPEGQRRALFALAEAALGTDFRPAIAVDLDCDGNDARAKHNRERFVRHLAKLQARLDTLVGEVSRLRAERLAPLQ